MKTLLTALTLTLAPFAAIAECGHQSAAMSCAEGSAFDAETRKCVPVSS